MSSSSHVSLNVPIYSRGASRALPVYRSQLKTIPENHENNSIESLSHIGRMLGSNAASIEVNPHTPPLTTDRVTMWDNVIRSPSEILPSSSHIHAEKHTSIIHPDNKTIEVIEVNPIHDKPMKVKTMITKVIESRIMVSLLVFVFTILLLFTINPPMAQEPYSDENKNKKGMRSWKKIITWSTIAWLLSLILPYTACMSNTTS